MADTAVSKVEGIKAASNHLRDRLRAQLGTERWARKPRDAAKENANPS